jgi:hypothetical protein
MGKTPNFLVLVSKGLPEDYLDTLMLQVRGSLQTLGIEQMKLTDSGTWFRERFSSCGDWDSWIWETVNGIDYASRELFFDSFVLTAPQLGRANASIASLALRQKRPVFSFQEDEPLRIVTQINVDDENNWVEGWSYDSKAIGG